ncbi:TPA: tail fiber domain-containing protein [Escherichia coli]
MIYTTGTIAISGNTATGTGTNFSAPLSLIRVGCTLIAIGDPVQIFTITEIKSGTELSVTPAANPAIPAGTKFSILLSDSISVDGLAQDVAETLRYYQGRETEIAAAVEWWKDFGGDGQMDQLLADIRAETAQSTANAQKTESDKNAAASSKTAAANSATAAKASQDAAKASEKAASNSKTAAATSETNAAKSAADALNYRNQAQSIVGTDIGLGSVARDCPDISGNPSGYIGFMRIKEQAIGFPSVASGEAYLTGFISVCDGSPTYTGIFQGWNTKSLYTYRWLSSAGPQWLRHARKDEISRFVHSGGDSTAIFSSDDKTTGCYLQLDAGGRWGYYSPVDENWKPLAVEQGGTGARDVDTAKKKLGIPYTGMGHWVDYAAPAGAEATKYYPVGITHPSYFNGDFLIEVAMRTKSISSSEVPNCNTLHLWLRDGGWSDMGAAAFGHYFCYAKNENAILCVRGTDKGQYPHNAIYVRGDAFPIRLAVTVGCTVTIPTADWKPANTADSPTYKWGITNSSDGIDLGTYGINNNLLDFTSSATGFYCTDTYRNKYGDSYQVIQSNGTIQPENGVATYSDQDWSAQQSDNVSKFKPIAGNINTPENSLTYGGFHVGFSGSHATQFAGRNSKFYARSFEAGVDKGWCQLATLNASSQRWTGYQQFKSTEFFTDTFSRKLSLTISTSAVRNGNIELWGASNRPTVLEYKIRDPETNASLKYAFYAQQNADDSIEFNVNGTVTCISLNQSSDRDLKDNIQVIGDATEAIRKMNGYTYTLKENGLPYAGVIAQEVMEALPEAVGSFTHYGEALQGPTTDGNELREETRYLNVDYAAVTGLLVQVARETDNRVTELEEENASLRDNIAAMDERIAKLEALVRQLTGSEE